MKFRIEVITVFKQLLKELSVGLRDLTFTDNFHSFEWSGTIVASETNYKIRHSLQLTPSKYIIVHQTGNAVVTAGSTLWDSNYVYMTNNTATDAVLTIIFFK
jgi:hypothetical protein